ncbi:15-cis-phytoene desaturase, chloroplastic/chromoplastic [Porphyridium purpureum]|uniref:15-cis-phytoene desaturase, chloroplastic/chromoplastic n=1 Tax=Porphyridium purpureum TaxID=35688 RepID=A0A5J4Z259_PORPP|nr:15-cis-phytoene desaturase, chloroplastic/chromoplastic [Porphyridium purpureum]|eukprot:POR4026..scf208_2
MRVCSSRRKWLGNEKVGGKRSSRSVRMALFVASCALDARHSASSRSCGARNYVDDRLCARQAVRKCARPRGMVRSRGFRVTCMGLSAAEPEDRPGGGVQPESKVRRQVVVVGAGWAGWGAAKALVETRPDCFVTLVDGLSDPAGQYDMQTPDGLPFEAGTRGFWKDYPNINALVDELGLDQEQVFTECTPSCFYGPEGLEATAPVFGNSQFPKLPSPLGQVAATLTNFERLPVADRVSMLGLLYAMLDFTRDEQTFEKYDRMTAHELFLRFGVSKRLVSDFLAPTLLVGLFKPPEELSAAVCMELLYFYALAHQESFDVRWIRSTRTIAQNLFAPLYDKLRATGRFELMPATFVTGIDVDVDERGRRRVTEIRYAPNRSASSVDNGNVIRGANSIAADGVVLAVGAKGLNAIMRGSPNLAQSAKSLNRAASLGAIDCCAVRLWLDRTVATRAPANVLSRMDALNGAGGTFFMLDQFQNVTELWAPHNVQGSVLACDFYNAGGILPLSDSEIVRILMEELLPPAVPEFAQARVVFSHVQRFPGAVSHFSPGSYPSRPTIRVPGIANLVCAGDWVRMQELEHGAKGLCQERAYVSGLHAANVLGSEALEKASSGPLAAHTVLPVRADEPQVQLGRLANSALMRLLRPIGLDSPWVR